MPRKLWARSAIAILFAGLVAAPSGSAIAAPAGTGDRAPLHDAGSATAIKDQYIVALRGAPGSPAANASAISRAAVRGIVPKHRYQHAFNGYAATLKPDQLDAVRKDPDVAYVADFAARTAERTSVSAPLVAGAAALYRQNHSSIRPPPSRSRC